MPYLHLDLPGTYPIELKRELAARLCKLYAEIMETQLWRSNVGIAELGKHNLYHRVSVKRSSAAETGSQTGRRPRPLRGEVQNGEKHRSQEARRHQAAQL